MYFVSLHFGKCLFIYIYIYICIKLNDGSLFARSGNGENLSATVYFVVIKHVAQKSYQPLQSSTSKNVSDPVPLYLFINNNCFAHIHYTAKYNCLQYKIPFQCISPCGQLDHLVVFTLHKG